MSLDQAIAELGIRLADEMTAGIYPVYDVLEHPVQRAATGFMLFLLRAVLEPAWGAFVSQIGLLTTDSLLFKHMTGDIHDGAQDGHFNVPNLQAAGDLVLGVQIEAIRRLIRGQQHENYVLSTTEMILRSLGVAPAAAEKEVLQAYERLCTHAPSHIPWWQPTGLPA